MPRRESVCALQIPSRDDTSVLSLGSTEVKRLSPIAVFLVDRDVPLAIYLLFLLEEPANFVCLDNAAGHGGLVLVFAETAHYEL